MEGFIYELAAGAAQTLLRPWLLMVAGIVAIAVLSGMAGRVVIAVENRLATPPNQGSATPSRRTKTTGGE